MDINTAINILKEEFPEEAINLSECLDLLLEAFDDIILGISKKSQIQINKRDFTTVHKYTELAEHISRYEKDLFNIINNLEPESKTYMSESEFDKVEDIKTIPDYESYTVDFNISHTLYEDLTHKRPHSFEFNNERYEVRTWQDVLLKTCEILFLNDEAKFMQFLKDPKMNGKKVRYFSLSEEEMRKPIKINNTNLFVETNMSANAVRNLIIKMLQQYNYKISDFILYFRADYSSLHEK